MKYKRMGMTGAQVSSICLGCMNFGGRFADWGLSEEESHAIVRKAVDGGINFFDTANAYGRGEGEEILGRALKSLGLRRDEIVVATKVYGAMDDRPNRAGLSRKHIMAEIDGSLKRLGLDHIDLYQIHRFDYGTPIEETIDALEDAVRAGKLLYIGASSMYAYQFAKYLYRADQRGRSRFVTMQNRYNPLYREEEREMIPLCEEEGIGLIPWSPLAGGRLARRAGEETKRSQSKAFRQSFDKPEHQAIVDAIADIAEARGTTSAQIALAWLLAKPAVTAPIVGASRPEQLHDALRAVDTVLTAEEIAAIEAPYVPQPVYGVYTPAQTQAQLDAINKPR